MSNISLGGNTGTSINFDGAALQNQQEAEYRKEEEQQQNELRALLTNAFDDLIDEDDILSITSEEGTDSRNVSLVRRHSNDSLGRFAPDDNKINEQPETDNAWTQFSRQGPSFNPLLGTGPLQHPRFGQFDQLSRTQELPRGQFDALRASVESLPNFPTNREGHNSELPSNNPSVHGSRDHLDSDYHSNAEDTRKADLYGNAYSVENSHGVKGKGHVKRVKGKSEKELHHGDPQFNNKKKEHDKGDTVHLNLTERDQLMRASVEDFSKFRESYEQPTQEHFHGSHGNQDQLVQGHQHFHSAEQPYDLSNGVHGQGHYYPGQGQDHHGYADGHYQNHHHHFQNIYQGRPYHTIGQREETEGGNVQPGLDSHYYHRHHGYEGHGHMQGYYGDTVPPQGQEINDGYNGTAYTTPDHGFYSNMADTQTVQAHVVGVDHHQSHPNELHNNFNQSNPNDNHNQSHTLDPHKDRYSSNSNANKNKNTNNQNVHKDSETMNEPRDKRKNFSENYKVTYQRENEDKKKAAEMSDKQIGVEEQTSNTEKAFMEQTGSGDNQQLAQLQILYKARGRKIEELSNEMEVLRNDSSRDIRILKHQLSVSKGEKEGSSKSLGSVQDLLQEAKSENAQLLGKVHASESQIEGLKSGKEELVKKLQTAESTIESLHRHLEDLGSSDSLSRARHDHEIVVGGLQKKYETEIKHLQEKIDKQNETINEKGEEITTLKLKLGESVKCAELAQVSRAETINRLTQSLEESQKRCRNLLESTSSHDMSQMKMQLQQALASKSISDEMCSGLQDEIQDLKEQVQMLESASNLGVSTQSHHNSGYTDQNDSMADLGIKKTLDFDTPQGTPTVLRSQSHISHDLNMVTSLKSELERCLVSNKQKRVEVTEMKEELKKVKKDVTEYKQRCERAELLSQEQKRRISELESCLSPSEKTNAVENRLRKDVENLKREKKVLMEDVEELQKRLDEISKSEEKLTDLNRELSKQISNMVREYDQDKRVALDRVQRACEQVSETSRNQLRQELTLQLDMERSSIITKYEKEINKLKDDLKAAQTEIDRVKDVYVNLCTEKDRLKEQLDEEWQKTMDSKIQQVKESSKKEEELALLRAGENWAKIIENEGEKIKEEVAKEYLEEKQRIIEQLQAEQATEIKTAKAKFENEIKAIKDIMEIEKSNDLEKIDKQKLNEIEKLKKEISEKEKSIESLRSDHSNLVEKLKSELDEKFCELENLRKKMGVTIENMDREKNNDINKLKKEMESTIENLLKDKNENIDRLKKEIELNVQKMDIEKKEAIKKLNVEMESTVARIDADKNQEINKLKKDIERLEREKEIEMEKYRKDDLEKDEVENLRKEIGKNIQKDRQMEIENLKKEVIRLKLEIDRMETDKQLEIEKVCRIKQAEIQNIEKRRQSEIDRLKKEKNMEIDRLTKDKDEEISRLKKQKQERTDEDEDLTSRVRYRLNREMEEDLSKTIDSKVETKVFDDSVLDKEGADYVSKQVAMSKVVWLEEHRATRQTAIDNAVRLAEAELRLKMEEELESKLEKRLEEAKILWQSDSMHQLEDDRRNWDTMKEEEISARLGQEHEKWRQTELQNEIESEKQKWSRELEQRFDKEKESWKEVELETEKLKWTQHWEQKLTREKESWVKNVLEPTKRKWKLELEEKIRLEKDNWRCLELEPEKLNLMREFEERVGKEREKWTAKDLPAAVDKEKKKVVKEMEDRLKKEREQWMNIELPREMEKERNKWFVEVEEKLREERKNWKNLDLPEEIEKERRKWMKLMETTLVKEKENWRNKELPAEVDKVKQELEKSVGSEVESKLLEKLEVEKEKLQKDSENKVLEAIEEHQAACKEELSLTINSERERLKHKYDAELQERFQAEKKIWREMVDQELNEKLEIEREKWIRKSESELNKKLESEKERLKSWLRADMEKRFQEETNNVREVMDREYKERLNAEVDNLRERFEREAREDFEHMKTKFESETREEYDRIKMQLENEHQMNLDKEKELMQLRSGRELSRKLESEEENWRTQFEKELNLKLQKEEEKWKEMIENDIEARLKKEKEKWEMKRAKDWEGKLDEEKTTWQHVWDEQKKEEMRLLTEKLEEKMRVDMDEEMEKFKLEVDNEFHHRVEHEVDQAVLDAREDWHREYTMEMSINTTSAEASQGLLREEIDSLKQQTESLQSELIKKEEAWLKEKEDLLLQKDLERRKALDILQDQTENEYKQFISEHKDTLDKALKASREQHTKEKTELEERYIAQLKLLQVREKTLHAQLQESLHGSEEQSDVLAEFEKERIIWYEERERMLQDISERDSLLGKADVHLSKEVDKLRSELQAAYQRRLETEINNWKQKIEAEFTRANNSEQKEKLQLEKQLSEVNTELKKLKAQHTEEVTKHGEEIKRLNDELNEREKKSKEFDRIEGELKKAKELLKGYKEELTDNNEKCQKYKKDAEDIQNKLVKAGQSLDKMQAELQKLRDEKSSLIESVQSIEASYRNDLAAYKQKQEEANTKIAKTEKFLQDMKQKYRSELESLRKALEAENDVAMNAMKNKMIELQKKHVAIVDELKKRHIQEKEHVLKQGQMNLGRGVTPTPNTGEVEDIDEAVKELRSQYLDTVTKIKGDVIRHITETNVRAAETVKVEMDKERSSTFQQIKDFYKQNVKQILGTEVIGSNLESKLLAVEEALDTLSSNPSSRSTTPKSDDFILEERQMKSRSRSATRDAYNRDAGISPKSQRTVSFTKGPFDDPRSPKGSHDSRSPKSSHKYDGGFDDPRSPKSRMSTKSPRDANVTVRGDRSTDLADLRSLDWNYDSAKNANFDTRRTENRPVSAKTQREIRDSDSRAVEERPRSAKSARELHLALREKHSDRHDFEDEHVSRQGRERERNKSGDKKKSRLLISTRDIHMGRYSRPIGENSSGHRAKSVTPMHSSMAVSSPSLYRPTSVPDLTSEDKELKVWAETNNDTYRYTPLRDTLRSGTNLHRSNSKSESDLSIAEKNFGLLKPDYDSNLDLSTGSLTSVDTFMSPRKSRDAGETPTPTATPRRHTHRKHYTMHSFPSRDQISSEIHNHGDSRHQSQSLSHNEDVGVNSPVSSRTLFRDRKNLPLIQFRHGKMQNLGRVATTNSKSPHPEEQLMTRDTPPTRDTTSTPERHYRPLSVSSNLHMDF